MDIELIIKILRRNNCYTPVDFAKLIREMQKEGLIEEIKTEYYKHEMTKYHPLKESDLSLLSARELEFIDSELEKHSGKSDAELSAFSYEDIP